MPTVSSETVRPKANNEFKSEAPADIYVVYSQGKWRIYKNSVHAHKRFDTLKKGGRKVKLIKYTVLEILRE